MSDRLGTADADGIFTYFWQLNIGLKLIVTTSACRLSNFLKIPLMVSVTSITKIVFIHLGNEGVVTDQCYCTATATKKLDFPTIYIESR
jgi:hypothetical protein